MIHISLIKQVACKNQLNDIIRAYERQKVSPRTNMAPEYHDQYFFEILDVRKVTMQLKLLKFYVHRVFIKAKDTNCLSEVGWVLDENCQYCLSCCKDFNILTIRHHCRACGDRICRRCTVQFKVESLENFGHVPVCLQCYRNRPQVCLSFLYPINGISLQVRAACLFL